VKNAWLFVEVKSNSFVEIATLGDLIATSGLKLGSALGSSGATVSLGLKLVASHRVVCLT